MNIPVLSISESIRCDRPMAWSYTTYYLNHHSRSPRTFNTIEEALRAICEKLSMHALDQEYPMISLVRVYHAQ
jgi:hypothetical protein